MIDFTNKTNGGGSFSEASLSYPTGNEALADPTLYNYIKTLYDASDTTKYGTDYTIAGSPTINSSGEVSGFTTTNYIVIPNFNYQSPFEIVFRFKASNVSETSAIPILNYSKSTSTADADRLGLTITISNSTIRFNTSSDGTSWAGDVAGITTIQADTWYWVKFVWNGTTYSLYTSLDNETYTLEGSVNRSAIYSGMTYFKFGTNGMRNEAFTYGTIDLNSLIVKVNDVVVIEGAYFPYKQLVTGSRVADVANLAQVQAIKNTEGSALYYVIDTTNETVRLPMGDIFGFITQAMEQPSA